MEGKGDKEGEKGAKGEMDENTKKFKNEFRLLFPLVAFLVFSFCLVFPSSRSDVSDQLYYISQASLIVNYS